MADFTSLRGVVKHKSLAVALLINLLPFWLPFADGFLPPHVAIFPEPLYLGVLDTLW